MPNVHERKHIGPQFSHNAAHDSAYVTLAVLDRLTENEVASTEKRQTQTEVQNKGKGKIHPALSFKTTAGMHGKKKKKKNVHLYKLH